MQAGNTVGVFQLESEGMRRTLKAVKPTNFGDIILLNAERILPEKHHDTSRLHAWFDTLSTRTAMHVVTLVTLSLALFACSVYNADAPTPNSLTTLANTALGFPCPVHLL